MAKTYQELMEMDYPTQKSNGLNKYSLDPLLKSIMPMPTPRLDPQVSRMPVKPAPVTDAVAKTPPAAPVPGGPDEIVIRDTTADPYAKQRAMSLGRLAPDQALKFGYGDNTIIEGSSSLPSGKINTFSGSSTPMTPAQQAIESARVAEGQRVAEMDKQFLQNKSAGMYDVQGIGAAPSGSRVHIVGGGGTGDLGSLTVGQLGALKMANRNANLEADRESRRQESAASRAIQMRGQDIQARAGGKTQEELAQIKAQTELYGTQKTGMELGQREAQKVAALEENLKTLPKDDPRRTAVMQELQNIRRQAEESKIRQIQAQALARVQAEQAAYGGGA